MRRLYIFSGLQKEKEEKYSKDKIEKYTELLKESQSKFLKAPEIPRDFLQDIYIFQLKLQIGKDKEKLLKAS